MGSFANTFLRVLLGWVQVAASKIWGLVTSSEGESLFEWLGRNYLTLAVLLCMAGMVVDGVVHWFRWRPFEVWRSFFRRMRGRRDAQDGVETPAMSEKEPVRHRRSDRKPALAAKIKLPGFLKDDDPEERPISYQPAPPAKSKADAFGKPFYPQGWMGHEESEKASETSGGINHDVSAS